MGGILLGGAALLFPNAFLHFFGADAATWDYTAQYLQILALGTPVIVFSNVFANLVRAEGAVQVAVMLNMLGTVTNIALDPLFISGLRLGVQGAAIATVLGNVLTALGLLFYLRRRDTILTLNMRKAFHMPHVFREIFTLGIPGSVSNLLMSAVNTITNRIVIAYGADTVAEMGAGGKAGMIVAMVVMAIALGVQPMFAYLYGAKNYVRLREIFRKSGILAVSLGIVLSVVCFIFRFPICGLFLKDEALVASAAHITGSVSSACRLSVCIILRSITSSPSAKRRRLPRFPFCGRALFMYRFCFRSMVCSVFSACFTPHPPPIFSPHS